MNEINGDYVPPRTTSCTLQPTLDKKPKFKLHGENTTITIIKPKLLRDLNRLKTEKQ